MVARLAALALLALVSPAAARLSDDIVTTFIGRWLVLPVDGSPGCVVTLGRAATIGGRTATPAPACAARVPALRGVIAWNADDGPLRFTDTFRRTRMAFDEDETALLSSPSVADPRRYLVPDRPGLTRAPTPATLAGAWRLARPGRPACTVTLRVVAVAPAGRHPLAADPACARLGLRWWRLEALTLYLEGPGDRAIALQPIEDRRMAADSGPEWRLAR